MSPTERFNKYKQAVMARAHAEAEERIALALLSFDFGEVPEETYEVTVSHSQIAKQADVSTRTVIRWIKSGELHALPKPEKARKYRVKVDDWLKFKQRKGL